LAAIVDKAADKFLEPQDADAFRSEFRDLVFRRAESESTGIYPRDAGSYGQVARDQIARVLTPEVFDRSVPGMSNVETSLGSPWGIQFSVWDSDPEIRKDYEDFRWDAVRKDRARDYLDALVTAVSDYELPNLFGNTGRSRVNVMGTNATRNYDVSTQGLDDSSRKALARYTGTGNISSIQPLSQATIENVNDLFDGNVYNAINSFLRGDGNSLSWIANPKDMERFAREVQDIDRAFASASLPASTVVYRGAFLDTDNPIGIDIASLMEQSRLDPNFTWENAANALRGQVVMDRGFSSFTERPSHAYTFIRQKANAQDTGQDRIGVLYQMQLPEGSPAIPLYGYGNNNVDNKIGAFPTEQEILLPREVPMRIVDAQFQFPLDVGQGSQGRQVHHLDPSNEIKPYLVVLVEPDFSGVR
jgi:hypothetical protein